MKFIAFSVVFSVTYKTLHGAMQFDANEMVRYMHVVLATLGESGYKMT